MPAGETQDGLHIRNNLASLSSEGWIWRQVPQIAGPIKWPLVQNALPHPQKLIKVINFFSQGSWATPRQWSWRRSKE